jgi:hypothetical protein
VVAPIFPHDHRLLSVNPSGWGRGKLVFAQALRLTNMRFSGVAAAGDNMGTALAVFLETKLNGLINGTGKEVGERWPDVSGLDPRLCAVQALEKL